MNTRFLMALCSIAMLCGCSGVRFIVDAVPVDDGMTETEVLADPGIGGWGASKIAMIDVSGVIADVDQDRFLSPGENPVSLFSEMLREAESDAEVKAVIVRINSPGGSVTATEIMYQELAHFRAKTGKPVIALMQSVAASGGYYLACGCDAIVAHPTTITGSIGVIMQTVDVSGGLSRIGVTTDAIVSGPNKAMGSPLKPLASEHRALMQGIVDEFYGEFVRVVKANRPTVSDSDIGWVTDGRVVTGRQAVEVGLVDQIGDLRTGFAAAKGAAGLSKAKLVKYHRPLDHVGSAYARAPMDGTQVNLLQLNVVGGPLASQPGFYYLWDPAAWN